jgi:KDO2-lipid IV(A) lauroyltransferase
MTPTPLQRLRARALSVGVAVLRALPDGLVFRAAYAAGVGLSLVLRSRRKLVRENLRQVCVGLVERDLASRRVRAALTDGRQLDRLTRAAFGHWVLAYAESIITTAYSAEEMRRRVRTVDSPVVTEALAPQPREAPGRIFVGLHFGCLELAAAYATAVAGMRVVAPMETVADPALQRTLERVRGATGIEIIPIPGAAHRLRDALSTGAAAALVADRPIGGLGVAVDLFGAPVKLPLGPAVLALESGAPVYVVAVRRTGFGRWSAHIERLDAAGGSTLRARIHAQLAAQARAFERIVAQAPEQWWTCMFPIWERGVATTRPALAEVPT